METVHILGWINMRQYLVVGDMLRQRQLDDVTIDVDVRIQKVNGFQELILFDVCWEMVNGGGETHGLAVFLDTVHVGLCGAIVADNDRRQMGSSFPFVNHSLHFVGYLGFDLSRNFLSVNYLHGVNVLISLCANVLILFHVSDFVLMSFAVGYFMLMDNY